MADHNFGPIGDDPADDLPRTFRREKEARAREAKERADRERAAAPTLSTAPDLKPAAASPKIYAETIAAEPATTDTPYPAVVRQFDVPFMHLVKFFLKAVFAAIPALILLTAILWLLGGLLEMAFPDLIKMKILIGFGG
jgi:hypothetical protein